jgi:hypothetical protein
LESGFPFLFTQILFLKYHRMSFQGPGTGISGYSAQFTVGYANSAGNINGYAPQAGYANQGAATAANIQSAQGINGTSWAWSGQPGTPGWLWGANVAGQYAVWQPANITVGTANYTNGNIGGYAPQAGYANQAAAYTNGNIGGYAPQAGYANQAAATAQTQQVQGIGSSNWAWSGQGGNPNHYWGSNQGSVHYVWQLSQGYVGYAGSAGNINGYAPSSGYAFSSGNATIRGWRGQSGNQYGLNYYGVTATTTNFNVSYGNYYAFVSGRYGAFGNVAWGSGYQLYTSTNPNSSEWAILG